MKAPKPRPGRSQTKRFPLPSVPEHTTQPAKAEVPKTEEPDMNETIRKMLEAAYT